MPRAWRFDIRLPRNSQGKLGHDDIRQVSTRRLTAPVWQAVMAAGAGTAGADASGERRPLVFEGEVPLDLVHFGGHFARFPLVPGVVEIDWIMGLARRHLD